MPAPVFTQDHLLLPPNDLAQLNQALANLGESDPLGTAVAEATDTVSLYCKGFIIADSQWRRLMRPIAVWALYTMVGSVPDAHQKAYESAMKELQAIRDGDFALPTDQTDPDPPVVTGGAWGSESQIKTR